MWVIFLNGNVLRTVLRGRLGGICCYMILLISCHNFLQLLIMESFNFCQTFCHCQWGSQVWEVPYGPAACEQRRIGGWCDGWRSSWTQQSQNDSFQFFERKKQGLQNWYLGIPECRLFIYLGDWFMDPLVKQSRMQRSPGRLDNFRKGNLQGTGETPCAEKTGHHRRLAWLNRGLWLELRKSPGQFITFLCGGSQIRRTTRLSWDYGG